MERQIPIPGQLANREGAAAEARSTQRRSASPMAPTGRPQDLLALQAIIGNQAVCRLVAPSPPRPSERPVVRRIINPAELEGNDHIRHENGSLYKVTKIVVDEI